MRRKPTLKDLSERLGLARSTVSRALRDDPQIALATRARVRALADAMGYRANAAARALTHRRAQVVGLMLPRSSALVFANPYFSDLLLGVSSRAEAAGFPLLLSTAPRPDFTVWLREGRVDGLLVLGSSVADADVPELNRLLGLRYPLVAIHAGPRALKAASIGTNEGVGVLQALAHLQLLGHRRVAMISGPRGTRYAERRIRAYRSGLGRYGLASDRQLLEPGDDSREGGAEACRRLLARGAPFDAILANNDLAALGALDVLRASQLRVPGDVSVIGFDDTPLAAVASPALTSIRQPTRRLGGLAFDTLLALMAGDAVTSTRLATELIVRDSTGPPGPHGGGS